MLNCGVVAHGYHADKKIKSKRKGQLTINTETSISPHNLLSLFDRSRRYHPQNLRLIEEFGLEWSLF